MLNCLGSISCEPIRAEQGGMEAQHFFQHPKISPMAGYSAKYRLNNQPFRFLFLFLFPPFTFSFFFPSSFPSQKEKREKWKQEQKFLFPFLFHSKFHFRFYNKYDRKVVLLIFKKGMGEKEKSEPWRTARSSQNKKRRIECINIPL